MYINRDYLKAVGLILIYIFLTFAPLIAILISAGSDAKSVAGSPASIELPVEDGESAATGVEQTGTAGEEAPDAESSATSHEQTGSEAERQNIEFLKELSVALGFLGMATMLLQYVLTSRTRKIFMPVGIDVVYFFHHVISLVSLVFVMAHPVLLLFAYSDGLAIFNFLAVPFGIKWGIIGLIFMIILVGAARFRRLFDLNYKVWRILHGSTALGSFVFAVFHIFMSGKYTEIPFNKILWIIYCVIWSVFIIYLRIIKPLRKAGKPYEVAYITEDAGDSIRFAVKPRGHGGFRFIPGQFAWLTVRRSAFSTDDHPFSFSSSSENYETIEFGIKELGDFTKQLKEVKPGETVYLDGPFGNFSIDIFPKARGYIFVAGGIGISPILCMIRSQADRNDEREHILFYGCQDMESITFRDIFSDLEKRMNLKVVYVLEKPGSSWQGEKGFISGDILNRHLPDNPLFYETFMCGPVPMMNAVAKLLRKINIPQKRIHIERFDFM